LVVVGRVNVTGVRVTVGAVSAGCLPTRRRETDMGSRRCVLTGAAAIMSVLSGRPAAGDRAAVVVRGPWTMEHCKTRHGQDQRAAASAAQVTSSSRSTVLCGLRQLGNGSSSRHGTAHRPLACCLGGRRQYQMKWVYLSFEELD
jgi:hypothetical protein